MPEALLLRKAAATSYQKADWCPRTLSFSFLTIRGLQRLTVWTTDGIWRAEPDISLKFDTQKGESQCLHHGPTSFHRALCQLAGVLSFMQHACYLHFMPAHRSQFKKTLNKRDKRTGLIECHESCSSPGCVFSALLVNKQHKTRYFGFHRELLQYPAKNAFRFNYSSSTFCNWYHKLWE